MLNLALEYKVVVNQYYAIMLYTFNLVDVRYFVSKNVWKTIQVQVFPELSLFLLTVPINCENEDTGLSFNILAW